MHNVHLDGSGFFQTVQNEICLIAEFEFTSFELISVNLISTNFLCDDYFIQCPYHFLPYKYNGYNFALRAPPTIG